MFEPRILKSMNRGCPIYLHKVNKVILPVFKCAYTSTHQAFAKTGKVLHSFNDLIDYDGVEKITLVRNPFARVVSLYTRNNQNPDGLHSVKRTFEEFVNEIERLLATGNTDGHYNTLVQNLSIKSLFMPDTVFKLENLQAYLDYLPEPSEPFPRANATVNRSSDYHDYYETGKIVEQVARIYAEDLDRFGYEF